MTNANQTNSGVRKITPVSIKPGNPSHIAAAQADKPIAANTLLLVMLPVVFLAALAVIFVLPAMISTPETQAPAIGQQQDDTPAKNTAATRNPADRAAAAISPWEMAQQSELRKQTQHILAEMLEAQQTLTAKGVEVWASADYARAMQHAEAGDQHYSKQDFSTAKTEYSQALAIFSTLLERVDTLFAEALLAGQQALLAGDAIAAHTAFDRALLIDPIDRKALAGKARAENIAEVFALLRQGEDLLQEDKLSEAKAYFQQAYTLDNALPVAAERIQHVDALIENRKFSKAMSAGFQQLQNNHLQQARQSFSDALRISPNSKDAIAALNQTRHKITANNIARLMQQAREHEHNEQWPEALENYQAALKLDANLLSAQQGISRAQLWADIHKKMTQILTRPERLYDPAVFAETTTFLANIKQVAAPGEKFKAKLARLTTAIARAGSPVPVRLQSDNKTQINLYKVGELGQFADKELVLRPGRYVAVGQREGYRDVRVEFFVEPDKAIEPIVIVSQEKIALSK